MSALPTRADLAGTPTRAELQTILLAMYDMLAQRLAAGTTGAGAASAAELLLARNSLGLGAGADIASAATLDLTGRTGNIVRLTGTTGPITAVTMANGDWVQLTAVSTPTFNVSGVLSYTCTAGDNILIWQDGSGVQHATIMNAILPVGGGGTGSITGPILRGHIGGLGMSTAGSSTTMTVAAGMATDSTHAALIKLASSMAKTTGAWAAGTGNGGKLSAAAIANSTWYYWYVLYNPSTGAVDIGFDVSATSPTLPSGYTQYRQIGGWPTNGSAQWASIIQDGDLFQWLTPVLDVSASSTGTAAVLRTMSVPRIAGVKALMNVRIVAGSSGELLYVSDPATQDVAPSTTAAPLASLQCPTSLQAGAQVSCPVNASAQIRTRALIGGASETLYIATYGWLDSRGRNS